MKLGTMTLDPMPKDIIGKILITKKEASRIVLPDDPTKGVSKFVLVEAVGADIKEIKPGDLVLPEFINNVWLRGGKMHIALVSIDKVRLVVRDPDLNDFVDKDGKPFEPAGSEPADDEAAA